MGKRVVFSGIQPSGNLHIGNYIGAIRHWVERQSNGLNIFCIVDLHAITVPQRPEELKEKTLELAALLLAAGIDPTKSILFIQSYNPDHANLAWVLNCFLSMGQLSRMTQYKEKAEGKEFVSVGLFDYPALMAADILLYDTTHVPVGEDQKQHVELTRDVAERFNSKHGDTFVLPKPIVPGVGGRIMSLTDPTKKMSKSDEKEESRVNLLDNPTEIKAKIMAAVTDSGSEIKYDKRTKPGISNLIEIYSQTSGKSLGEVEKEFAGKGYVEFKEAVSDAVIDLLVPLQEKYRNLRESKNLVDILREGAEKARKISHKKLLIIYEKVGFVING
ncbi:tryptophan--tRNA ligase [Candidatus Woesebacteria bacterium]|nr:tryptophan--tRNA ligase [Candidatus Woesebacteria bacterium]